MCKELRLLCKITNFVGIQYWSFLMYLYFYLHQCSLQDYVEQALTDIRECLHSTAGTRQEEWNGRHTRRHSRQSSRWVRSMTNWAAATWVLRTQFWCWARARRPSQRRRRRCTSRQTKRHNTQGWLVADSESWRLACLYQEERFKSRHLRTIHSTKWQQQPQLLGWSLQL